MNNLENIIGKLSEESIHGPSRREFIKLLLATGGAVIMVGLGIDSAKASGHTAVLQGCSTNLCSIPCDSRAFCLQRAAHHNTSECNGNEPEPCPSSPCGNEQYCKQLCKRCCYPNQCSCGSWTNSKSCKSCSNPGSDQCLGCSGNCPSSPEQKPDLEVDRKSER